MTSTRADEIFIWKEISIKQDGKVFKIGTDALLLGAWVPKIINDPGHILDAGTGTGIIALMMAHSYPDSKIAAIDIEEEAICLAISNFQNSKWPERLEARIENMLDINSGDDAKYDLILCNPPYYFNQYSATEASKATSKHTLVNSVAWLGALSSRLKPTGHLCVILPHEISFQWIKAANEFGVFCQHRLEVFSFRDDPRPIRSLIHFHAELCRPEVSRMNIYEQIGSYSEEYFHFSGVQHSR